jgi:ATP-dependent DNA helicase RecG
MPNKTPQFIEGDVFKTIIPLANENEFAGADKGTIAGVVAGVIAGVTEGVKDRLVEILQSIANDEGKRTQYYSEATQITTSSMDRYMRMLREENLIEFKGATNVGGYYLTDFLKQKNSPSFNK